MVKIFFSLALTLLLPLGVLASFGGSAKMADRNSQLVRLLRNFPKTLNPILQAAVADSEITEFVFDSVARPDPDTGEIECWLCTELDYGRDRKSLMVKLHPAAKFHDNAPLTAEDVAFTYGVILNPKIDNLSSKSKYSSLIDHVEIIDSRTLKFVFKDIKYMNAFALDAPIIPKHLFTYYENNPEKFNRDYNYSHKPIGSGPYQLKKYTAGLPIELERNEDWWGFKDERFKGTFNFKKVIFKVVTDTTIATQLLKRNEVDYLSLLSFEYPILKNENSKSPLKITLTTLEPKVGTSVGFIAWNSRRPLFADSKTRQALALLTNRQLTLEKFAKGMRKPTNGMWGIKSPFQCPQEECPIVPFDPARARKLLAEAGWADVDGDGILDKAIDNNVIKFSFTILTKSGENDKNILNVYAEEMRKQGIEMKIRQLEFISMLKLIDDLKFDAYMISMPVGYPLNPRLYWHSENTERGGMNSWGLINPDVDRLIGDFEKTFDFQKRAAIGHQLHKVIYNLHPVVFHHEGSGCLIGYNNKLQGVDLAAFRNNCVYWPRWYKK